MDVVYSSSDLYSEIAAISIISLFENNKNVNSITVYIVDEGISVENKNKIKEIAITYNRNIYFLKSGIAKNNLVNNLNLGKWHISTFNRLFIHMLLPKSINKAIYLDCDTLILSNLEELWNTNIDSVYCLAVDDCRSKLYRKDIGIENDSIYTNNGVMLMNLDLWRKDRVDILFKKNIEKYKGYVTYVDQGVLNSVFQPLKGVRLLPLKYNVQTIFFELDYNEINLLRKPVWKYSKKEFNEAIVNPAIIHFTSFFLLGTRPWFKSDKHIYKKKYDYYRSLSPWKNAPYFESEMSFINKLLIKISNFIPKNLFLLLIRPIHSLFYPCYRILKRRLM